MGLRGAQPRAHRVLLITTAYPIYDDFWTLAKGGEYAKLLRTVERAEGPRREYENFRIPAEPDTLIALLEAETPEEIKRICRRSKWMERHPYSYLKRYLPDLASQFLVAKDDRRFPKSERPSSIPKKFWFLACALAGAMHGLSPRRAVNLVGPGRPEEIFDRLSSK